MERNGTHTSGRKPTMCPWKSGGAMPTTVNATRLIRTVDPTTSGSPPKRFCQNAWSSTTTVGPLPAAFSSGVKNRPRAGWIPTTSKYDGSTKTPEIRSPSPPRLSASLPYS